MCVKVFEEVLSEEMGNDLSVVLFICTTNVKKERPEQSPVMGPNWALEVCYENLWFT